MLVHELKSPKGSRKRKRIVGRGQGSGTGQTAGKGENGQRCRRGRWAVKGSEGGQTPLIRRLPKVGFNNPNPTINQVVNVSDLDRFKSGTVVTKELLKAEGLISSLNKRFKILSKGEIKNSLTIQGGSVSKSAIAKIEKAGGKIELFDNTESKEKTPKNEKQA